MKIEPKRIARQGFVYLTGADVIVDLWRATERPTLRGAQSLKRVARSVFRARPSVQPSSGDGKRDFEDAMQRLGVADDDLPAVVRQWWWQWAVSVLLIAAVISAGVIFGAEQARAGTPPWLVALSVFAILPVLIARAGFAGANVYMVRARDFGSPLRVLRRRSAWIPDEPSGAVPRGAGTALILLLVLGSIIPSVSYAANLIAAAPSTDPSIHWIDLVVPPTTASPWSRAVATLSAIMMLVASASVGWSIFDAMIHCAHAGELLGQNGKFHSLWGPVRVVIAMAMLAPVAGSGMSGADYLVAGIYKEGVAWGDKIWSDFVHSSLTSDLGVGLNFAPSSLGGQETVEAIARLEICRSAFLSEHQGVAMATRWVPTPDPAGHQSGSSWTWDYGRCGGIGYSGPNDAATTAYNAARAAAIGVAVGAARALVADWASGDAPGSDVSVQTWPVDVHAALAAAGAALDAADVAAAKTYLNGRTSGAIGRVVAGSDAVGWTGMGTIYRTIGQFIGEVAELAGTRPSTRAPANYLGANTTATLAHYDALIASISNANPTLNATDLAAAGDATSNPLIRLLGPAMRAAVAYIATPDPSVQTQVDPMARSISAGQYLLSGTELAITAGGGVALAAGSVFGKLAGADSAWQWASGWAMLALGALLSIAITQALIIPNLIYISTISFVLGWYVTLIESAIAINVYFVLWARFDGQDFLSGEQKGGITMLLNGLLRPAFGALAIASTFVSIPVAIGWVDQYFGMTISASTAGSTAGIVTILFVCALHALLHYHIVLRLGAQAVLLIPDLALRWLGVGASAAADLLGAHATSVGLVAGVRGAASGATAASGGNGGGGGGGGGSPGAGPKRGGGGPAGGARAMGGASPGVSANVSSASGGSAEAPAWMRQTGGFEGLSPDDQVSAIQSHDAWIADRESRGIADSYDLPDYVNHAQSKQAERANRR